MALIRPDDYSRPFFLKITAKRMAEITKFIAITTDLLTALKKLS